MKERRRKILDGILSVFIISGLIWMYLDYERFLNPDFMPTGKGAKVMIIINNILDKIGGKTFSIIVLSLLVSPFVIRSVKGIIYLNEDKDQSKYIKSLSENDIFYFNDYKIHVVEIKSSKDGFSGIGWIELGIVNKVKKTVEFKNIELNEGFISIKGDLIFLDVE
jgi:hypothetical protein